MTDETPDIRIAADAQALSAAAAREVAELIGAAIGARRRCTIALAGGTTPRALYARLASPPYRTAVTWQRCEFFWGDERAVPPEHPESNYRMARESLLGPLGIEHSRVHRMAAERADLDAAALEYEAELMRILAPGKADAVPQLDLVLLGMGTDGHTASLFPGCDALTRTERWAVADRIPALDAWRMTLTLSALNAARCALFVVAGAEKSETVARVLEPGASGEPPPAARVRPRGGRLLWRLDRGAAARLRGVYPSA